MKKSFLASAAICFSLVLAACGPSTKDVPTDDATAIEDIFNTSGDESYENNLFDSHGKLSLDGTQLVDCHGAAFQLKGVSTHGIAWFPQYVNRDAFASLRDDWGVNCIRLAMYSDESSGYCSGGDRERLKNLIMDGVAYATELDMYVIIDWHVLGEHDPNVHKDEAKAFFADMSKLYADYDNVIYEICNEPNSGVSWSQIKDYAEEVIPTIKANSPDALIIVGTPNWSQDVDIASADPIEGFNNILYTIHFYADTHRQDLRNKVQTALDNGLPLFCSEFGICDASGNGSNNRDEAAKWIKLLDDNGISYCIWNLSNKNESSSLIKASCIKTSGWSYDDLSDEGQWYVDTLGKKSGALIGEVNTDSSSDSGTTNNSESSDSSNSSDNNVPANSASSGDLSVDLSSSNSWQDGSNEFVQYAVSIKNGNNSSDAHGWTIAIEFDQEIELDQSWNGTYKVIDNNKSLIITPADYNTTVNKGSSITDIGFIIKSAKTAKITKVSIN